MATVKDRLAEFLSYMGLSQKKFAQMVGVSDGFAANIRVSIQPKTLVKISTAFPELNTAWLLTGEGEMLKQSPAQISTVSTDNTTTQHDMVDGFSVRDSVHTEIKIEGGSKEWFALINKKDEQIDRLLAIIERMQGI